MHPPVARRRTAVAVLIALAFLAGACSSSSSKSSATTLAPSGGTSATTSGGSTSTSGATIVIKNFSFHGPLTAKAGATVTVSNQDTTTHTVAADNGTFDTKDIAPGTTATFRVAKAGTYKFHCNIHNYMTGTLTITG
jgi:plastocyanin